MPVLGAFGAASLTSVGHFRGSGVSVNNLIISGGTSINLRTAALAAGWDGSSPLTVTVTGNVGATNNATPAMTIAGGFPGGVTMTVNSGVFICGAGGAGNSATAANMAGGLALSVSSPITIINNGTIGGGGGGGRINPNGYGAGGGGAGIPGGAGSNIGTITNGGTGNGGVGAPAGSNGGTGTSGGGGGLGGSGGNSNGYYNTGHTDPSVGDPDPNGSSGTVIGGAPGACASGNTNITWQTTGTRYGALN